MNEVLDNTEYKPSVVSLEESLYILNTYYTGLVVEWGYYTVVVSGHSITYNELIDQQTIWVTVDAKPYALLHRLVVAIDAWLVSLGYQLPKFNWRPHQILEGFKVYDKLERLGWVLVQHMPRTGKTGTVLYGLEHYAEPMDICIVTTKNAMEGWENFIALMGGSGWGKHRYTLTTPYRLHKLPQGAFDVVVFDESHKVYSTPKPQPSNMWLSAKLLVGEGTKCIFVTATPHAQSINQLYWQLALCSNTPFIKAGYTSFKSWFSVFGIAGTMLIGNGVAVPVWTNGKVKDIYNWVKDGVLALTQEDVGFDEELLPTDRCHYVELADTTKAFIADYVKRDYTVVEGVPIHNMNARDSDIRLHQIEGSTLKYVDMFAITDPDTGIRYRGVKPEEHNWILAGKEKVAYIKDKWGDTEDMVIMYYYVNEGKMLRKEFKNAKVLQGKSYAEGIDLYMYKHLIVYSMDYSVSTYIQRRDRQVHLTERTDTIEVHYLVSKGMPSETIYQSVVEKGEDLTGAFYDKAKLLALLAEG